MTIIKQERLSFNQVFGPLKRENGTMPTFQERVQSFFGPNKIKYDVEKSCGLNILWVCFQEQNLLKLTKLFPSKVCTADNRISFGSVRF